MTSLRGTKRIRSVAAGGAATLLLSLFAAVVGLAASLGLTTGSIGAARVAPARCASAALSLTPTLTGTTWTGVTVAGIPAACGGATLQLSVNTGTTNSSGSAVVPGAGGSVAITLAAAQTVDAHMQTDLVFVGP